MQEFVTQNCSIRAAFALLINFLILIRLDYFNAY